MVNSLLNCADALRATVILLALTACLGASIASPQDLYVGDIGGQDLKRLTHDELIESRATWSPDGSKLLYSTTAPDQSASTIYIQDVASGNRFPLLQDAASDFDPVWMPSGDQVLFSSDRNGNLKLFTYKISDQAPTCLTGHFLPDTYHFAPIVSVKTGQIAFTVYDRRRVALRSYVFNPDSNEFLHIASDRQKVSSPSWTPDGRRLLYQFLTGGNHPRWKLALDRLEYTGASNEEPSAREILFQCTSGIPPLPSFSTHTEAFLFNRGSDQDIHTQEALYVNLEDGESSEAQQLSEGDSQLSLLSLSPNGKSYAGVLNLPEDWSPLTGVRLGKRYSSMLREQWGQRIGVLMLGAHGEIIMPHSAMAAGYEQLEAFREDREILIRMDGYGFVGDFLRISEDGKVTLLFEGLPSELQRRLPRRWPYTSALNGAELPPANTVIEYSEIPERRAFDSCRDWLVETADGEVFRLGPDTEPPVNVICVVSEGDKLICNYDGPDRRGLYARVSGDLTVEFLRGRHDATVPVVRDPLRDEKYWGYKNEEGKPVAPPNESQVFYVTDPYYGVTVHSDGNMSYSIL